ncbi:MAG: hypothetical protein JWP27_2404, partial [Flaviaesturariibacter sp.]|nr:hypothetical protein [Flaviaesturariibacter sp.]
MLFLAFLFAPRPAFSQDTVYRAIARQDSLFFHAYNTCDLATQAATYADTIEF